MVTKRKSEFSKARGDTRRAVVRMVKALPIIARVNWRTVVMPWRLIPMPVALALIALVALAMVLDNGDNVDASAGTLEGQGVMIGGDTVDAGTRCEEDEVITYRVLLGGSGVGCVNVEYVHMAFILECLVGNADHGDNLASLHLRDPAYGSWCSIVVDDATDGVVSLGDLLFDTAYRPAVTPTMMPTMTATAMAMDITPTMTPTPSLPKSLPSTGSR